MEILLGIYNRLQIEGLFALLNQKASPEGTETSELH